MVEAIRLENLIYDEGECFFYRISNSLDPNGMPSSCYPGLTVSITNMEKESWIRFCMQRVDFDVIDGENISEETFAELAYLILTGVKTGYKITYISIECDSVHIFCEHPALSEITTNMNSCPINLSLPIAFSMYYRNRTFSEDIDGLALSVKTPRVKNGKHKWRKFRIICSDNNKVYEYHKKYCREIQFLQPTHEQKKNQEQPVEIRTIYL